MAGVLAAAVVVGTAYVLVHEHRRKGKKEKKRLAAANGAGSSSEDQGLTATRLIEVLGESANAAYQLIEQVTAPLMDPAAVCAQGRMHAW